MNLPSQHAYPIHSAAKYNSHDCVKPILKFDEQCVHVKDTKYGGTPLHWAKTRQVQYMMYDKTVIVKCIKVLCLIRAVQFFEIQ
jgi:calcium-independent phospholipase A2